MNIFIEYLKVFICGGVLCIIAQIIIDKTKLTPARVLVGYVVSGVILTGAGIYEPFVDFAKSGATVPLTGFGYALAKGVQKAVAERGFIGILTGGLTATAAGIAAVILLGSSFALIFSSKEK
jgi:stage V sporulation protein AE